MEWTRQDSNLQYAGLPERLEITMRISECGPGCPLSGAVKLIATFAATATFVFFSITFDAPEVSLNHSTLFALSP